MVGGKQEVFERCRPVLESFGRTLVYCGPNGSGQVVKLCNQVVVGLNNLAMGEALVLAAKAGVAPATMVEAVRSGAGASWILQNLAPRILSGDFRPGFKVAHQQKDLRLALELANQSSAPLPGTGLVHQLFAALEAEGLGEEGTQSLVKALEKLANTSVTS
jgi:3-hydroxyisobutyrate dehydrogenase